MYFNTDSDEYGWWFSTNDDTYDPLKPSIICKGYEESYELIKKTFAEQVFILPFVLYHLTTNQPVDNDPYSSNKLPAQYLY